MRGISILICCYNSAARINETLEHVFALNVPAELLCEVILVDNNSIDDTRAIAIQTHDRVRKASMTFKVVIETTPGLFFARSKGIQESKFELILFCDDDNHLNNDYLEIAARLFDQQPAVAIAGGWVKPKLSFYPGKWIEANYGALAIEASPKNAGYVDWVFGAGMIIRKNVFNELKHQGISLHLTGRLGMKQTSGDDAELCHLVRFLGYKIYYSPELILYHKISPHRLTKWNFIKVNYKNVFMVVYFYILDRLARQAEISPSKIQVAFLKSRVYNLFYFFPRIFFGKNSFYSFMMFYQNFQLTFWIFLRKKRFLETYNVIKSNLYK